jgi:hypothetical protein
MRVTLYSHSNKETNATVGERIGLVADAFQHFLYAGYEHKMEYEVDTVTGKAILVAVDDRPLLPT